MTNDEARELLSKINLAVGVGATPVLSENEILEATSMAIEALESQQRIRKIIDDFDNKHQEDIITSVHEYINDINDVIEDIEYQLPLREGESE